MHVTATKRSILLYLISIALAVPSFAAAPSPPAVKILVEQDRMYRVAGRDLIDAAGMNLSDIDPAKTNLYNNGETVPIKIERLGPDGAFAPETAVKFWGRYPRGETTRKNLFTRQNAYLLRFDDAAPPHRFRPSRPLARPSFLDRPQTEYTRVLHLERDGQLYKFRPEGYDTDFLIWAILQAPPRRSRIEIPLAPLADLAPSAKKIEASVCLLGHSYLTKNPDHDWTVTLNGDARIGPARWDGRARHVFTDELPAAPFRDSKTSPTIGFLNNHTDDAIDSVLLDWIELEYRATLLPENGFLEFRLADAARPVRARPGFASGPIEVFDLGRGREWRTDTILDKKTGRYFTEYVPVPETGDSGKRAGHFVAVSPEGYLAPAAIRPVRDAGLDKALAHPPDYLIVAHRDFIKALEPLAEHRRRQGLRTALIDIEDVYNAYSHGLFSPFALRRFMDDLLKNKETAPRYLFLVGGATYDYANIRKRLSNFVPTYHKPNTEMPSDKNPRYAYDDFFALGPSVSGDIGLPLLSVGRLPAREASEVRGYVRKIIEFETASPREEWRRRLTLVAANGFEKRTEQMASAPCFGNWRAERVEADARTTSATGLALQTRIVDAISSGTAVLFFAGHGSFAMWRTGPIDYRNQTDLFTQSHIERLRNRAGRYPLVFAATCYTTIFDSPNYPLYQKFADGTMATAGVGVSLVLAEGKGALACVGHVSKTDTMIPTLFASLVCERLFGSAEPGKTRRLGDGYLRAKREMASPDIRGVALIGDPAMAFSVE